MTQLTEAQAKLRNADTFRSQLTILNDAAVGVVLCRTREPHRAVDAIKALAFAKGQPLKLWTIVKGWQTFKKDGSAETPDGKKDPNIAHQMIGGLDGSETNGEPGMGPGFYVSMYPHHWLKQGQAIPAIIQTIKEYCRMFASSKTTRLVLVVPPGFTLPPELEEDVTILDFEVPSFAELSAALEQQISDLPQAKRPRLSREDKDQIIAAGSGMQLSEFDTAFARAVVTNKALLPDVPATALIEEVMKVKIEVVKRSEVLEVMPSAQLDDIGGLENLKEWLAERAHCFGEDAKAYGIEAPKGIALIGPPGTGKSLAAKATAGMLRLPLIRFDVGRVFAGIVGASEERVRAALKMIDSMAPCVVMLDEVDKAFQRNSGGGDSGVSQRVLGAILTHMQESDAGVFWVATANRVDNLPSEFLRRGRLDEVFSVSIPDEAERLEIISIHLRKRGKDPTKVSGLAIAAATSEGYVPAELEAAVKDAIIRSYASDKSAITGELIVQQIENMKPLSEAFAADFAAMQSWAENNARPASRRLDAEGKVVVAAPRRRIRAAAQAEPDGGRAMNLEDA